MSDLHRMSNYPNGFNSGAAIRGMPVLNTYGKNVWWVDSGGAQTGDGTFRRPFAAIDTAINHCAANDIIMVKPGHGETITAAAGIDADVQGISIIGMGSGTDMPEVTFSTATTADMDIDAANITVSGIRFKCAIDSLAAAIDVNSADFSLLGCEFHESSATGLTWVDVNGGASNACDRAKIIRNRFYCATAANWDRAIELGEVADGVEIADNYIVGDFDDAGIHNPTGKVLTNLFLVRNYVRNNQAGQHAVELVSACTGTAFENRFVTDALATGFDAGALSCMGNLWNITTGGDSEGQPVNPIADTASNFIGVNDADNEVSTSSVAGNADGSVLERLEYIQATGTAVQTADATTNTTDRDVVGNKTDASIYVPGTQNSLAAYAKGTANLQERVAKKAAATLTNGVVLFTVAGGPIEVLALALICETSNNCVASTIQFSATPTTGSAQTISGASASVANATAGASITLAGTALATAALYNNNGPNLIANPGTIMVPIGTITAVVGVGSTTGTWAAYIRYKPLAVGVTVS